MITALIVAGVILFLLADAYILVRVLRRSRSQDDYGLFPVPGETTVSLQPGKLRVTYQESYRAPSKDEYIDFEVPGALEVTVTSFTGEPMEIKGTGFRGMGSSVSVASDWSRAVIGTVEITSPGNYTVTATGELPDAIEPQILLGK